MPAGNPTAATVIRKRDPKESARAATTAALPANTRVGNVLTADVNGALPAIDGVTLAVSDPVERVLVKNEATGANNGIYDVTDVGGAGSKWVLTRSADFDSDEKVTSGAFTFVSEGTANAGKEFSLLTADPIIVNTTVLTFSQTGGAGGDADAIHDNVAAEISAITEKVTPIGDDVLVIEDSADSNNKKRTKISGLPTGTHPVVDTTELVKGSADATKRIRFEVDGLTTGTLRVITMPDQNVTLIDTGDSRLSDARAPTAHASDHTDGTDDIQDATAAQKGVATATQITKLDGIETAATADQTNAEIETAYNAQVAIVSQGDAEAGTATVAERWTPERVKQAIAALGVPLDSFELDADQFEIPVSGDRPASIVSLAPTVADSVNAGLAVLRYDDTDEEARQFSRRIKVGALTMKLQLLWRAQTAPGDTVHDIGWKLYWREIPDGGAAPSATWAGTNDGSKVLTEIANIADDVFFHEVEETLTLVTEGILLDREYQFLLSRVAGTTNLVGDWVVRRLAVEID